MSRFDSHHVRWQWRQYALPRVSCTILFFYYLASPFDIWTTFVCLDDANHPFCFIVNPSGSHIKPYHPFRLWSRAVWIRLLKCFINVIKYKPIYIKELKYFNKNWHGSSTFSGLARWLTEHNLFHTKFITWTVIIILRGKNIFYK